MGDTTRTFVAIAVPESAGQKLTRFQTLLASQVAGVRWSATPPFHMTLAFLGDVAHAELNGVCRAVAAEVAEHEPFSIRLNGLGAFPGPERPRVLWVGVAGSGLPKLEPLQKSVVQALREAGHPPADDRFHPHVTIGRLKPGRAPSPDVTRYVSHYRTWSAGAFPVNEVIVFASTLTSDGPSYAALSRAR